MCRKEQIRKRKKQNHDLLSYMVNLSPLRKLSQKQEKEWYNHFIANLKRSHNDEYEDVLKQFKELTGQDYEQLPSWQILKKLSYDISKLDDLSEEELLEQFYFHKNLMEIIQKRLSEKQKK